MQLSYNLPTSLPKGLNQSEFDWVDTLLHFADLLFVGMKKRKKKGKKGNRIFMLIWLVSI